MSPVGSNWRGAWATVTGHVETSGGCGWFWCESGVVSVEVSRVSGGCSMLIAWVVGGWWVVVG